jgi:hypothetical protein
VLETRVTETGSGMGSSGARPPHERRVPRASPSRTATGLAREPSRRGFAGRLEHVPCVARRQKGTAGRCPATIAFHNTTAERGSTDRRQPVSTPPRARQGLELTADRARTTSSTATCFSRHLSDRRRPARHRAARGGAHGASGNRVTNNWIRRRRRRVPTRASAIWDTGTQEDADARHNPGGRRSPTPAILSPAPATTVARPHARQPDRRQYTGDPHEHSSARRDGGGIFTCACEQGTGGYRHTARLRRPATGRSTDDGGGTEWNVGGPTPTTCTNWVTVRVTTSVYRYDRLDRRAFGQSEEWGDPAACAPCGTKRNHWGTTPVPVSGLARPPPYPTACLAAGRPTELRATRNSLKLQRQHTRLDAAH